MTEPDDDEKRALEALGRRFLAALAHKEAGRIDEAEDGLRAILRQEPRLAEPRLELARVLLDTDRLDEAEDHAREALDVLEKGGQWTDDLPETVVQALAHATLAEILRRKADEDDVIFGDPDAFQAMVREAQSHFARAATLDPRDEYASYHAIFMGQGDEPPPPGQPDLLAGPTTEDA
jgi:tetratricopeptide (TPR) repeat protein